jgi:hypothetical protein
MFSDGQCSCGTDGTWTCVTSCPSMLPSNGAACDRPAGAACSYSGGALQMGFGSADATCTCASQMFTCLTQADCPSDPPAAMAACTNMTGLTCTYSDQSCACGQNGWTCQTSCPAQPPATGDTCNRLAPCYYASGAATTTPTQADTTCNCSMNAFACYTAADCPAAAPMNNTACEQPGLTCSIDGQTCVCSSFGNVWFCGGGFGAGGAGAGGNAGRAGAGAGSGP